MDRTDLAARGWRVERMPIDHPDAAALIEELQAEYLVRYGGRDNTPIRPGEFDPPAGAFFVGHLDGAPTASGAWRRRSDVLAFETTDTAEIKRMYVAARARGCGLGRLILAHLEETARAAGVRVMILETGTAQPEAMALYESSGYTRIEAFGHYGWNPQNRCYARDLGDPSNGPPSAVSESPAGR